MEPKIVTELPKELFEKPKLKIYSAVAGTYRLVFSKRNARKQSLSQGQVYWNTQYTEFGFLVMGHEFNGYPNRMIREIKNWNWFIKDEGAKSDVDEDSDRKGRKGARRKRKKKGEGDDDEWTGESEDEKELPTISKKLQGSKYITRSRDKSNAKRNKPSTQQKTRPSEEEYDEDEEEDEEDETLGGFIVDDAEEDVEVGDEEEEEEEEFDADEDDEY